MVVAVVEEVAVEVAVEVAAVVAAAARHTCRCFLRETSSTIARWRASKAA